MVLRINWLRDILAQDMQIQKINKCSHLVKMELKMRNTIPSAFIPDIMSWKMNRKVMEDELQGHGR
jgi:hypothetical protein